MRYQRNMNEKLVEAKTVSILLYIAYYILMEV